MRKVSLALPNRPYSILVGNHILEKALTQELGKSNDHSSIGCIFADARLKKEAKKFQNLLNQLGWKTQIFFLKGAEETKDFHKIYPLYGKLLNIGANRHTFLFALGGGVIGDITGFVAATYLRGIPWVSIPTTLLGQVDSGIGGKTGINHIKGKNLIGAFHQPSLVICDVEYLHTLDIRDRISGLGEMIKYGLIYDSRFFETLEAEWKTLLYVDTDESRNQMISVITKCAQFKSLAVKEDEHDLRGVREFLNFGHTIGHALEAGLGYGFYRHGEAIIQGMRAATWISWKRKYLSQQQFNRIEDFLSSLPVPGLPKKLNKKTLLRFLKHDKKKGTHGKIRFILIKEIGKPISDPNISECNILEAIEFLRGSDP